MRIIFITLLSLLLTISCKQKEDTKPADETAKPELEFCTKEAKQCTDGHVVGRNAKNKCEFDPCPQTDKPRESNNAKGKMCTADVKECKDGSFVGRDHYNNCAFRQCPPPENGRDVDAKKGSVMCTADVQKCPDGSYVSRDHQNKCQFKLCPDSKADTE